MLTLFCCTLTSIKARYLTGLIEWLSAIYRQSVALVVSNHQSPVACVTHRFTGNWVLLPRQRHHFDCDSELQIPKCEPAVYGAGGQAAVVKTQSCTFQSFSMACQNCLELSILPKLHCPVQRYCQVRLLRSVVKPNLSF